MDMLMNRSQSKLKDEKGQTLVEFALVLIFLLIISMGIVEFGNAWYRADMLKNAANIAARTYAIDKDAGKAETASESVVKRTLTLNTDFFIDDTTTPGQVTVTISEQYQKIVPVLLPMLGNITLKRDATYRMEQ